MSDAQLTEHLSVRMTPQYSDILKKFAKRQGLKPASLARSLIRGGLRQLLDDDEREYQRRIDYPCGETRD